MTKEEIKEIQKFLEEEGENIDVILYGAALPAFLSITKRNGDPVNCSLTLGCSFRSPSEWTLWERVKFLIYGSPKSIKNLFKYTN